MKHRTRDWVSKLAGRGASKQRTRDWVSKSDMTSYVRCPYAFWLVDSGQITRAETVTELQRGLIAGGVEFQTTVEEKMPRIAVDLRNLSRFLREHSAITLFNPPLLENRQRRLFGQPDGIDIADGALYPVEIKAHKDVQRIDQLELAFYWLLLEPWRTRHDVKPEGLLILRRSGGDERVRVPIGQPRFSEVARHIENVRLARRQGVRPRICGCTVCSQVKRDDVLKRVVRTCDVTLIFGVGRTYASVLEAKCSIRTWKRLINCDEEEVSDIFRSVGYHMVTPAVVAKWKLHAQAYSTALPALRVQPVPFPVGDAYLTLDLEYDEASHVWLVGAYVVSGTDCTHIVGWGDDDHQEKKALRTLMKVVTANPHLPVVTWSGTSADIPVLVKAGQRSRVNVEPLLERHVDLYTWVDANLRLPIPRFGLTEVAAYFGIPRVSAISGGLEAVTKYRRCVATGDVALREQLLDYNRDDLDCLVGVVHHLRALFVGRE